MVTLIRLFALLLFSVLTVAVDNHYISNGTCYYKAGAKADDSYAPAGNIIYGHTFCCALGGDKINSNNVCYNDPTKYTYLAGCTDPTYTHSSCPYKGNYSDYQWVGLSLCEGKGWAGCVNDGSPTLTRTPKSEGCSCDPDEDEILFNRGGGLDAVGFMPDKQGETISYLPGMRPTSFASYPTELASAMSSSSRTLASPSTRSATASVNGLTIVSPQPASASSSSTSAPANTSIMISGESTDGLMTSNGLSHGAVAGISIGSCATVIFLVIGGFLLWRQQKQKRAAEALPEKDFERDVSSPGDTSTVPGFSEADSRVSTYTETKSELPGSPVTVPSQRDSLASQQTQNQPPSPSSKEQVYRPYRYRPADGMQNIQELPTQERSHWAQTSNGIIGLSNANSRAEEIHNGRNVVHELPG